jgi:hypothetical protein
VDKIGNSPLELSENDVVTISYIVAKINSKLCQITKDYPSSRKYAEHILRLYEHKKNKAGVFIISNFKNMEPDRLYKPAEIRGEINRDMQPGTPDDISDLAGALTTNTEVGENECVTSKDVSRALKALENDLGLVKITNKQSVKNIKGKQKIEFSGRPSFYKLPPNLESIKRIIAQPNAIKLVFDSLVKLGILPHLQFVCEASFYALREYTVKEQHYDLARLASKLVPDAKIDKAGWDSYRDLLLSLSEEQLKILANGVAQSMTHFPGVFRNILLVALSKNP